MRKPPFDQLNLEALAIQNQIRETQEILRPLENLEVAENKIEALEQLHARAQKAQAFRIGFVGTIKTGKSTLLTALLNGDLVMPAEATVCTAALTRIHGTKGDPKASATPVEPRDIKLMTMLDELSPDPRDKDLASRIKDFFKREAPGKPDHELEHNLAEFLAELDEMGDSRAQHIASAKKVMTRYRQLEKGVGWSWPESEAAGKRFEQVGKIDLARWASIDGELGGLVSAIDIHWPLDWLPEQAALVDTPGLQDPVPSRSRLTYDEMRKLDAVVLCIGGNIEASHLKELARLREFGIDPQYILIARTRADHANSARDLSAVIDEMQERIAAEGWPGIPIVPVCAFAASVALTHSRGLDLIDPNSDYRNAEDAVFLAKKLERLFGMEQDPSLDLEARLWRASNLDALVQALGGIVKATNEARANLPEEAARLFQQAKGDLKAALAENAKRVKHLEHVASGTLQPEEDAAEAKALRAAAEQKRKEAKTLEDAREEGLALAKTLGERVEAYQARLLGTLQRPPRWIRVHHGGVFFKDVEISLVTRNDGKRSAEALARILPEASELLSATLGQALRTWASEAAPEIEQTAAERIGALGEYKFYVSDSNWAEVQTRADADWQDKRDIYIGKLVESFLEHLSETLAAAGKTFRAQARDLKQQAAKDDLAAEVKNREEATLKLQEAQAEIGTLETALSQLQALAAEN